ncbi:MULTISPECIES: hypothetical protein [unclassified Frondihabitans]|uniref:hypothetical protein n=1 Tax=unclassified Frondihabitans TaxID=2626248 RepID=UPI000F4F0B85|nr:MULTISPECIES: hypothetical protein [unclassified Frondihabitans]RPE77865.1 hypothetical protein EDF37_0530 [Frondihabitans sp. PhB153]RPF08144.1 hypothetical protein EDF39_0531 [Frondihabitans sp. PhB161]
MAENINTALDDFRLEIDILIALGGRQLTVRDNNGECPVVAALEEERLPVLLRRVESVGGYANVFTKGRGSSIRHFVVMDATGALDVRGAETMLDAEQPSPESTVGMFVDYLSRQKAGVLLPARLRSDGSMRVSLPTRQVELIEADA